MLTCPQKRQVGRRNQRTALPAQVELITQVRRPQSKEGNKGERLVGAETSIIEEAL